MSATRGADAVEAAEPGPIENAVADYAPGRLLVRFRDGVAPERRLQIHSESGGRTLRAFGIVPGLEVVTISGGQSVEAAVGAYTSYREVLYAEPDFVRRTSDAPRTIPQDQFFPSQWALDNNGQSSGSLDADIDAPEAWAGGTGSAEVVVGVIDSGIDFMHPDLSANVWRNEVECDADLEDDDDNGYIDDCHGISAEVGGAPLDDNGHGTHVAGIIGATGDNPAGIAGVNWAVKLLPCKALDATNSGFDSWAIECLDYMADQRARGVPIIATNNSYGGEDFSAAFQDAILAHSQAGILFVAAAGNEGSDNSVHPVYPANFDLANIISVASTNPQDELSWFSNYGKTTVHLAAPGEAILSTLPNNSYGTLSGTSMAAPHVAGVAALLKAQGPDRDWAALRNLIFAGVDPLSSLEGKMALNGRLNAANAANCSNRPAFSVLSPGGERQASRGLVVRALNVNCAIPAGPLSMTLLPSGTIMELHDDGVGVDLAAGDGVYSAAPLCVFDINSIRFSNGVDYELIREGSPSSYGCKVSSDGWRDVQGTSLRLSDDEEALVRPGFAVRFRDQAYSRVTVSDNGALSFDTSPDVAWWVNSELPAASVSTLVAPHWADLEMTPDSPSNVFWAVAGSAPQRELIIEWRNVAFWGATDACSGGVRFQVVLSEANSDVVFAYHDVEVAPGCSSFGLGRSATVGVQRSPDDAGQLSFDSPQLSNGLALRWTFSPSSPGRPVRVVTKPTVLSFHGNLDDGCTGQGQVDATASQLGRCRPFLSEADVDQDSPAARWGPVLVDGTGGDRQPHDPGWVWVVADPTYPLKPPTTLKGQMTVVWWASCAGCGDNIPVGDPAQWKIKLWADPQPPPWETQPVPEFEAVVEAQPQLAGVAHRLEATVDVPELTASDSFMLQLDPVYGEQPVHTDQPFTIFYDSSEPCPTANLNYLWPLPCDSWARLPVVEQVPIPSPADFDGNGSTEVSVYRPSTGQWFTTGGGFGYTQFGTPPGDVPVPADYDGSADADAEVAIYRTSTGQWFSTSGGFGYTQFGTPGDVPVPTDYDGDGDAEVAVYRPDTGQWFTTEGGFGYAQFGTPGDVPVPADYDDDGDAEVAVYRPDTGQWFTTEGGFGYAQFGMPGDVPVPADYDGDGDAEVAVYRPDTGQWFSTGGGFGYTQFGMPGDVPVPADYDGDGDAEIAVYRPSTGQWFTTGGGFGYTQFGTPGDVPLPLPAATRLRFFP